MSGRRRLAASERRARLVEVARAAFAEQGYRRTTTLEVAKRAEVSETLVLQHFGSKEGMFRAAVIDPFLELLEARAESSRARMAAGSSGTPMDDFHAVLSFLEDWALLARRQAGLSRVLLAELPEFPDVGARLVALLEGHIAETARLTGLAASRPDYRRFDAWTATYMAIGAATMGGLMHEDPRPFLRDALDIIYRGVLSDSGRDAYDTGEREERVGASTHLRR